MGFHYLSIPYNSKLEDPLAAHQQRLWRMEQFWLALAYLISERKDVVSPMTLETAVNLREDIPSDWEFWQAYSHKLLNFCTQLVVLCLPGWEQSSGVTGEIAYAREIGIPIRYMYVEADGSYSPEEF